MLFFLEGRDWGVSLFFKSITEFEEIIVIFDWEV